MITAWDDEYLSPSVVNLTFPYYRYRPRDTNRTVCAIKKVGVLSILFVVGLLAVMAEAQQPKKVPRIGYLSQLDAARESTRAEGIRLALRELGFVEGQNIATEYRYTEGKIDRYSELAAELVRLKVDIIVTAGGDAVIQAAKNATKTIPIVMVGPGSDPVEAGFVESLARPGGNVTGVTNLGRETRREAAGAAQRSRAQSCSCRGALRCGLSTQCNRGERGSPSRGARWN